jgi:hypothetical protein
MEINKDAEDKEQIVDKYNPTLYIVNSVYLFSFGHLPQKLECHS